MEGAEAMDFLINRTLELFPGKLWFYLAPTIAEGILIEVRELGGVDHQLFRDTAANHAGTPDQIALSDRHLGPIASGPLRSGQSARSSANHK